MRKQLCVLLIGMAASAASLMAQGSTARPANQVVVIGCLQGGAQNGFTLTDDRSSKAYRIDADAEAIGWHVGHELEIHGSLEVRADGPRVKAEQIVFVATHCSPPEKPTR
jgi:hypothetical protein